MQSNRKISYYYNRGTGEMMRGEMVSLYTPLIGKDPVIGNAENITEDCAKSKGFIPVEELDEKECRALLDNFLSQCSSGTVKFVPQEDKPVEIEKKEIPGVDRNVSAQGDPTFLNAAFSIGNRDAWNYPANKYLFELDKLWNGRSCDATLEGTVRGKTTAAVIYCALSICRNPNLRVLWMDPRYAMSVARVKEICEMAGVFSLWNASGFSILASSGDKVLPPGYAYDLIVMDGVYRGDVKNRLYDPGKSQTIIIKTDSVTK